MKRPLTLSIIWNKEKKIRFNAEFYLIFKIKQKKLNTVCGSFFQKKSIKPNNKTNISIYINTFKLSNNKKNHYFRDFFLSFLIDLFNSLFFYLNKVSIKKHVHKQKVNTLLIIIDQSKIIDTGNYFFFYTIVRQWRIRVWSLFLFSILVKLK